MWTLNDYGLFKGTLLGTYLPNSNTSQTAIHSLVLFGFPCPSGEGASLCQVCFLFSSGHK